MESTIRQNNSVKHELDVTLMKEEIEPYLTSALKNAQKNVAINGFRKGHVPLAMIKKMYGPALMNEAYEEAVQKEFSRAIDEQKIVPIGTPQINHIHPTADGGLHFTVAYEVMPQVELGEYKGIPAKKIFHIVEEEEIQAELERIRENYSTTETAESISDSSHAVRIDLQRMVDDQPQEGNVMRDVRLFLNRPDVNQELKASLMNTRVGDTFRIDLPTGDEAEINNYEVTVQEIQKVILPELDDELAKKATQDPDATMADLNDYVKQGVEAEYERRYTGYFRDELIGTIIERHGNFDVPDVFVAEVLKSFAEEMKNGPKKELPKDFDQAKFAAEMQPTAERTVRWAILRDMIIDQEDLQADDVDYEGLADLESQRTGIDYETLLGYFKKSDKIRDRILAEKAIQFLEDYATVDEVEDRELAKEQTAALAAAQAASQEAETAGTTEPETAETESSGGEG
ncbi:MAG: trigger factor [Chlorobi bacterium]|nr:trigger factor [Chlorobiota bacterium]